MTVTLEAVRALPKIELHRHLEGTVRPDTVHALAAANGTPLPVDDMRTLYTYRDLRHFLEAVPVLVTEARRRYLRQGPAFTPKVGSAALPPTTIPTQPRKHGNG
jgi:hypothetical protein